MATVSCISDWFFPLSASEHARNWTQDADGVQRRMLNRATMLNNLAAGVNHLCGNAPASVFWMSNTDNDVNGIVNATPYVSWMDYDYAPNSKSRIYHVIVQKRQGYSNAWNGGAFANSNGLSTGVDFAKQWFETGANAATVPGQCYYYRTTASRNCSNATVEEVLSVFNGYRIVDMHVHDEPVKLFDTDRANDFVDYRQPQTGEPVLRSQVAAIANCFYRQRKYNLGPEMHWTAQRIDGKYCQPAATNASAIVITNADAVNVLDVSTTTRTATSPGFSCHGYRTGTGLKNYTGVQGYILANSTRPAQITFIGPNTLALNSVTVDIAANAATISWTEASSLLYLNTLIRDNDSTDKRNKIDIHANVESGGTLYIYGLATIRQFTE